MMKRVKFPVLSGALMVSGVCIGAGMLGIPVKMAEAGLFPTLIAYLICSLLMGYTGLLYAEACLWFEKEVNLLTLTEHTLGKGMKALVGLVYIFLFYTLIVAYLAGGGEMLHNILPHLFQEKIASAIFALLFVPIIFLGTHAVDKVNQAFMYALILSFICLLFIGISKVDTSHFQHMKFESSFQGLPIILTAFGFQGLVPTLLYYHQKEVSAVKYSIILGCCLTFCIYVAWIFLMLGIIPLEGQEGLLSLNAQGKTGMGVLEKITQNPWIFYFAQIFALSALVTSFLGVALPLVDFLADGFAWKKSFSQRVALVALVLGPPTVLSVLDPSIFIKALLFAGTYGGTFILGLLPIVITWMGRKKYATQLFWREKTLLVLAFVAIAITGFSRLIF